MKSIISNDRACWVCGSVRDLHKHHVFGGANRNLSETYGCWLYLCAHHHNMSNQGIHFDPQLDALVKKTTQRRWMTFYGKNKDDFIRVFGRSYI